MLLATFHSFFALLLMQVFAWAAYPLTASEGEMGLFSAGRAAVRIRIPVAASEQTKRAAAELARCLEGVGGSPVELIPLDSEPHSFHGPTIQVGASPAQLLSLPPDLGTGFVIRHLDDHTLLIAGENDWGTEFGVYSFLEEQIGVRWFFPGNEGEFLPAKPNLSLPRLDRVERPVFQERLLSGFHDAAGILWLRRHRAYASVSIVHNMTKLFPSDQYAALRPDFYGFRLEQMARLIPKDASIYSWQPCLTAPGIAEAAAATVNEYFRKHPDSFSFSLSLNDSERLCQEDGCANWRKGNNFIGLPDYSDLYFDWVNRVVALVGRQYPEKWLGVLAYRETFAPPSFDLMGNVWVYITYDRMKWLDPRVAEAGIQHSRAFLAKAARVGWYDYLYGSPYLVPRVGFQQQAEIMALGARLGVKGYYGEAYPNWLEGPKYYLAMKLSWNPALDAEQLVREWCEGTVGKRAGKELRSFYRLWESVWKDKIRHTPWFSDPNTYLFFGDPSYLHAVSPTDMRKANRLLRRVLKLTENPRQREFALHLLQLFEYSDVSYQAFQLLGKSGQKDELRLRQLEARRRYLLESFRGVPILAQPMDPFLQPKYFSGLIWSTGTF